MSDLHFVPTKQFERVRASNASPEERCRAFATLARINTLSMIAFAGSGHVGSSFSAMDIVSWLYLNEMNVPQSPDRDAPRDIYYSSKGHDAPGLYSVLIGLDLLPEAQLTQLRTHGGLPGHPDITLTPYIEANTGSLGMGISKAKGMVAANRLLGRKQHIYVMTGDGELQEGQIWESLGSAARRDLGEIIVVVDHNKVQSDTYVADTADLGDLEAQFAAFGWHVQRCDGHDLAALGSAFASAKEDTQRPSIIIADTIKGCGVSFMRHTNMDGKWYQYHSGAPSVEDYDRALAELKEKAETELQAVGAGPLEGETVARPVKPPLADTVQRLVPTYGQALIEVCKQDERIVALDADLVLDNGLIPFSEQFPERFIECGIAEQDMVSQASGLALAGLKPVAHSFACFLTPRANEQIYNASTEIGRILYVGTLAGVIPGEPGHSHQSVRDLALMGCIPGLSMIEPCSQDEVVMATNWLLKENEGGGYLRLVSVPCELPFELPADYSFEPGKGVALTEGDDAVLFAYGPVMLAEAVQAAQQLQSQGVGLKVVNLPWLNRFDASWLSDVIGGAKRVFTLDNHYIAGGQGERIAALLAGGDSPPVTSLGLSEVPACGHRDEVLRHHKLDATSIAATVKQGLGA